MNDRPGLATWEDKVVQDWERAWGIPRLEAYDSLASTNDRCREMADLGAQAFTSVISREQTAGRGRAGRSWSSPPGLGLWMSVLLRPESPESHALLPILAGVAVCRAIQMVRPEAEPSLKWPNDVQLGGRKVCGILCEGVGGGGVVVGPGETYGTPNALWWLLWLEAWIATSSAVVRARGWTGCALTLFRPALPHSFFGAGSLAGWLTLFSSW